MIRDFYQPLPCLAPLREMLKSSGACDPATGTVVVSHDDRPEVLAFNSLNDESAASVSVTARTQDLNSMVTE